MKPIFYQCPFFTVYTYGVFVGLAFLVSSFLLMREARRKHVSEPLVYDLCILLLVAGIVSARLFYVALNWPDFKGDLREIFMLQHGGLVWFGGLIGACLTGAVFMKIKQMPLWSTLDLFAPYAALAQAIGRIGCFFNGCCHGKLLSPGVLFPAQLVDSLTLLLVFALLKMAPDKGRSGTVFSIFLMLASLQRFLMEFLRGDIRPFYFSLSIFQWISIALFLAGLFLFSSLCKKRAA